MSRHGAPRMLDLMSSDGHRVREGQSPTSDSNGMDYQRCAVLHNTIIKHGWRAGGQNIVDMPLNTWWEATHNQPFLERVQQRLHSSMVEFLKLALIPPSLPNTENDFFYFSPDLVPANMITHPFYMEVDEKLVPLYMSGYHGNDDLVAVVYNQEQHACVYIECDFVDLAADEHVPPWQPLESLLSVWLDMIERGKVVALHKDVQPPPHTWQVVQPDGSVRVEYVSVPEEPQVDPASSARRVGVVYNPWVMQPYCEQDLTDTLARWNDLVEAVEDRMPAHSIDRVSGITHGLYETQDLLIAGVKPESFAFEFFRNARRPQCKYLGPGLRLPTAYELTTSPTMKLETPEYRNSPISVLRGDETARSPFNSIQQIPWGVYLCQHNPAALSPFEDAARLVLPYDLGSNRHAKLGDGSAMSGNADLFQIGWNPFMPSHPVQLLTILVHLASFVKTGMFDVDDFGVAEKANRLMEADTDMARWHTADGRYPGYVTAVGPGERFW